jgi:uncharacterized protein
MSREGGRIMQRSRWEARLNARRRGKDKYFRVHPDSPIPPESQRHFKALRYFPPDPAYRFELDLHEHPVKSTVRVRTTHGGERDLLRWGEFRFTVGGIDCVLQAYRTDERSERLFVPFRDATAGLETPEMGRYLDLEPQIHRSDGNGWIVDFNEAYNPWCEYSQDYLCPYAPPENWIEPPIRAGEMRLPLGTARDDL